MLCWRKAVAGAVQLLPAGLARKLLRRWHPFDLRYGTDTGGLLYAPELATGHPNDQFNEGYYATAPSVFRGLISRWECTLRPQALRLSDYAFIDLGCGKGRVLLMASEFGFRSVSGIELNPHLCAAAQQNVQRWQRKRSRKEIEVICADVLSAPLLAVQPPDVPLLLFLFNSFEAAMVRELMERITLLALVRSAPIYVLYVHPDHAALVERAPGVRLIFDGDIPFTREDRLADVFGVAVDRCRVYRIG